MAFRRRFGRRRRFRRRSRGGYKSKFTRMHRNPGRIPRAELKYHDAQNVGTVGFCTFSAGSFVCLNAMQEGASAYNRIGRRINMKSLLLKTTPYNLSEITAPAAAAVLLTRLILFYDGQPNGLAPNIQDLLATTRADTGTAVYDVFAPINLNNRDRFLILMDRCWTQQYTKNIGLETASTQVSSVNKSIPGATKKFIRLKGLETCYNSNPALATHATDATCISTGSLMLYLDSDFVAVADGITRTGSALALAVTSRLRFYD